MQAPPAPSPLKNKRGTLVDAFLSRSSPPKGSKRTRTGKLVKPTPPVETDEAWDGDDESEKSPSPERVRHNTRPLRSRKQASNYYEELGETMSNFVRRKFVGAVKRSEMEGDDDEFMNEVRRKKAEGRIVTKDEEEADGDSGEEEAEMERRLAAQAFEDGMSEAPQSLFGSDEEAEYDLRMIRYVRKMRRNKQYARNLRNYLLETENELDELLAKYEKRLEIKNFLI